MSGKEKRRAPRTKSDLVFEIFSETEHLVSGVGKLLNVSAVGGLLETASRLDCGQTLRAHVRLDDHSIVALEAKVVWLRPKTSVIVYGLEFSSLPRRDLDRLTEWLKERGGEN